MRKKKQITTQIKSHVKSVSAILAGYGVGEIMGSVMKDFKPDAKGIRKALIKLGAIALTGMVIKSVNDFVDGEIDEIFDTVEEISIKIEEEKIESENVDAE